MQIIAEFLDNSLDKRKILSVHQTLNDVNSSQK